MVRRFIVAGPPKPPVAPFSWAVLTDRTLYSVHVPIHPDGSIETGGAARQTEAALADLEATLDAAGAALQDVAMGQIFLTSLDHKPAMDEVYRKFFKEPYPVRACVAVAGLRTQGTIIELAATTELSR
jgi:2-iminobutanoate/2-iminopropanoate deaminase